MSKEYSQQQLTQFFNQFKKLENSITIEKVHQIINNPNAMARYKVKHVKPLKIIIMTSLICLTVVLALWFSSPGTNQENTYQQGSSVVFNEPAKTKNIDFPNKLTPETKLEATATINCNEQSEETQSTAIEQQQTSVGIKGDLLLSDGVIDGSKFILELTNEELEKLGFKINHFAVFYRNHYNNQKVFYLATHFNGRFFVRGNNSGYNMEDYYPLQTDIIPASVTISQLRTILRGEGIKPQDRIRNDAQYLTTHNSFYPYFCSNQQGEIQKLDYNLNFYEVADTLMPVVIKYSQLDLEKKHDQFFWFLTNNDFYKNLPERYAWVKEEFEKLKTAKRVKGNKLNVDFKVKDWNKELQIPRNVILDGKNFIVQFTKEELEKVGVFKKSNYVWFYNYKTPYSGSAGGLLTEIVDGKPQHKVDTTFNVDYYAKYTTDCTGDFPYTGTTIKQMDDFFNDDDILLPVQSENKEGDIYWFTLSEEFWKLVPERYQYLKKHYEKMLYNKSIEPKRNFVTYFKEPFKKIGVNVSIIELTKKELENIGFKYVDEGAEINCGFGKNYIHFSFKQYVSYMPQEIFDPKTAIVKKDPPFEHVSFISPNRKFVRKEWVGKFDSLYAASNQGYQFVYITDSLGRHMHKINISKEDLQINGEDFKYLIPIMVRFSKVTNPLAEDRVFWFTPTEAFFDRLPDRIKNELRKEYEVVSSEGKSAELSACTYFESCRSTLKVENMKIYPNPAQKEITIDFYLKNVQAGEILLANIAGQQIKVLKSQSTFDEGFNSVKCDINGIKPGIYLVSIVTTLGFKTERLIVSE